MSAEREHSLRDGTSAYDPHGLSTPAPFARLADAVRFARQCGLDRKPGFLAYRGAGYAVTWDDWRLAWARELARIRRSSSS